MKRLLITAAMLLPICADAKVHLQYLSAKGGYANGSADWGSSRHFSGMNGFAGTIAYGNNLDLAARWYDDTWFFVRQEFEANYSSQYSDGLRMSPIGANVNFYFDFGLKSWFIQPYIGAGLGAAYIITRHEDFSYDDYVVGLNYNFQLGASFPIIEQLTADASVRYVKYGGDPGLTNWAALLGLRFDF